MMILPRCCREASMEKDGLNMKNGISKSLRDNKGKDYWHYNHRHIGSDSISSSFNGGFLWPPRSYTCSFCKREFKSAQALGGHMNVHRRDRARLKQSPPWDGQTSNPNPNSSFSPSSPTRATPVTYKFTSVLSPSLNCFSSSSLSSSSFSSSEVRISGPMASSVDHLGTNNDDPSRKENMKAILEVGELRDFIEKDDDDGDMLRKREVVRLDLEIGLGRASKDDLDLELRLGYT